MDHVEAQIGSMKSARHVADAISECPEAAGRMPAPQSRAAEAPVRWRTWIAYRLSWMAGKVIEFRAIRVRVIRPEIPNRAGGYLLACTHLSHLEPMLFSLLTRRSVDWMTRIEFFRHRPVARYLYAVGAFAVRRQGVPVSAIRTAIARAKQGRVVGICPEGGVATGEKSVCRGGAIKRGVCLVAARANVPIIPCVMLGTHDLNRAGPWMPYRPRVPVWAAFGRPIWPETSTGDRRAARAELARKLEAEYVKLYQELLQQYGLDDADAP
jgi:1-acyl-sn-glycerol-3-phosphate acyltransferase